MLISTMRQLGLFVVSLLGMVGLVSADEGMWTLNRPPTKALKQKYDFKLTPEWLDNLQKSCVRMGSSGSLVSPNGLLMTNHHVGDRQIEKLSTPERNLIETGFYARTRQEELKCPGMEVQILWSIKDITDEVNAAASASMPAAAAFSARRKAIARIEQETTEKTGLECQIVTLYHGARYHLYRYKRYADVRLVMTPEQCVARFGGDHDNFEYPRFDLDMCFFRIYENGQPLKCEHYLRWSHKGAEDGELTFVVGHPRRTQRLYTMDHLKFLRDAEIPIQLNEIFRQEVLLSLFADRSHENASAVNGTSFSIENRRKSKLGIYSALLDPRLWADKQAEEERLRSAVRSDPEKQARWGDAWERIAGAEKTRRESYRRYIALQSPGMGSELFHIAHTLVRLADERPKPDAERLREFRDSKLESVFTRLYSPAPIHETLEVERLRIGLIALAEHLGGNDPLVVKALGGLSPQARAEQLVGGCALKDVAVRKELAKGGRQAIEDSADPLIALARLLDPDICAINRRHENEVESVEEESYARIGAARFAVFGEDVYPDATGTLRLAFGPIRGYQEGGHRVPPFTTFAGLYQRLQERRGQPPFNLPKRWLDRKDRLNLDTPLDFVCTADITGGNSGSPVVNKSGEVIGLVFDGNLPGLAWDIAYSDTQGRAIAVDSRAIIEALRKIYDADALADEITARSSGD